MLRLRMSDVRLLPCSNQCTNVQPCLVPSPSDPRPPFNPHTLAVHPSDSTKRIPAHPSAPSPMPNRPSRTRRWLSPPPPRRTRSRSPRRGTCQYQGRLRHVGWRWVTDPSVDACCAFFLLCWISFSYVLNLPLGQGWRSYTRAARTTLTSCLAHCRRRVERGAGRALLPVRPRLSRLVSPLSFPIPTRVCCYGALILPSSFQRACDPGLVREATVSRSWRRDLSDQTCVTDPGRSRL